MVKIIRSSSTNSEVTDYYLSVIKIIVEKSVKHTKVSKLHIKRDTNKDIIITPTAVDFAKNYFKGYKYQIYWMQGIDAEESFMRNGSTLRSCILDSITKFAMKKAIAIFYVSKEMKIFQENKFNIDTGKKSFIMPCFNVDQSEVLQVNNKKYKKNIFTYVGSLSAWQCFEEMIEFFKSVTEIDPNSELRIFTFSEIEARKIVQRKKVKNCIISSVPPEMMTKALEEVKFGFVLRKNEPVNYVATPTKLSTYLSAGVIPIFSDCLKDFYSRTAGLEYVIPVSEFKPSKKLKEFMTREINITQLNSEYGELFNTYYNPLYYINKYTNKMYRLLEETYESK